jgi:cytochrome oxidase Cu insertion factor (SCO1/SenC/PrrC family)
MVTFLILAGAAHLTVVAGEQDTGMAQHPMIGGEAPQFELQEVGGGTVTLASLKGRYVVIHFGASW